MIRINEIVNAFRNLVGWDGVEELNDSKSGLYFQEAHPMLTLRAMRGIIPCDLADKYPSFDSTMSYNKGDKVNYTGTIYKSLINGNDKPIADKTAWVEYDLLIDFLERLTIGGIKKVVTRFLQDKIVGNETKSIVDRRALFDGLGSRNSRVENNGRIVGFELSPLRSGGITTTLNKIGLQFIGNEGTIKLYLFNSNMSEPMATKEVSLRGDGTMEWISLDWALPYMTEDLSGGDWYVVYNQRTLPYAMDAINFNRDWSREPCGTCNKGDAVLFRLINKYLTISPFYVAVDDWDGKLWDIEDNVYTMMNNYGLNFLISMDCDLTDFIIREKGEFASVLQLQVATEALRTLAMNPDVDVNRVQYNASRDNILYETDGNGQGIKGLKGELEKAYKALEIDTSGLSEVCLGCHNKGIRFKSV